MVETASIYCGISRRTVTVVQFCIYRIISWCSIFLPVFYLVARLPQPVFECKRDVCPPLFCCLADIKSLCGATSLNNKKIVTGPYIHKRKLTWWSTVLLEKQNVSAGREWDLKTSTQLHTFTFPTPAHIQFNTSISSLSWKQQTSKAKTFKQDFKGVQNYVTNGPVI
jgi:hypothetical protein